MDYQPDETERKVLDLLREEHRANPMRIREQTDVRKQYVNDALTQLRKAGVVEKVNRGLYEHVPEADDDYTPLSERLQNIVDDAREAHEELNGDDLAEALDRLAELVEELDGDP